MNNKVVPQSTILRPFQTVTKRLFPKLFKPTKTAVLLARIVVVKESICYFCMDFASNITLNMVFVTSFSQFDSVFFPMALYNNKFILQYQC